MPALNVVASLEEYFRRRIGFVNDDGGRGWEFGTRVFESCPECGEKGKAWLNASGWIRCFRVGCVLCEGLPGVELVQRAEGFRTRSETVVWLRQEFPALGPPPAPAPLAAYDDWCELPGGFRPVPPTGSAFWTRARGSHLLDEVRAFARRQWGLSVADLHRWGVGYCAAGRYAWRIVVPVVLGGRLVAFQARSYRGGEPKYLTSKWGARGETGAECGRPAEAMLFNLDSVREGSDVVVVEGAGDAMRWAGVAQAAAAAKNDGVALRGVNGGTPVALLGTALTDEKAALLAAKGPGRVTAALDAGAERESRAAAEKLRAWGLAAGVASWVGGKDAGEGAMLEAVASRDGLAGRVAGRLGR